MDHYIVVVLLLSLFIVYTQGQSRVLLSSDGCNRKYKKIGCFKENFFDKNETLFNLRHMVDWKDGKKYLHNLACECHDAAFDKKFKFFSLRFYGICVGYNVMPSLEALIENGCNNGMWSSCQTQDPECVGQAGQDFFYEISYDGEWSAWSDFAPCTTTCGGGFQGRSRLCDNPKPSGYGLNCIGEGLDVRNCGEIECPADNAFSSGSYIPWSDWSECNNNCGKGETKRTRKCKYNHNCRDQEERKPCENFKKCNQGKWDSWGMWSSCSATCDAGRKERFRSCNKGRCNGKTSETTFCFVEICKHAGNGGTDNGKTNKLSEWSPWSPCSEPFECKNGFQVRERSCDIIDEEMVERYCDGELEETKLCFPSHCTVDGGWSLWSLYSSCSVTCGTGQQTRTRECNSPLPAFGGKLCDGNTTMTRKCLTELCEEGITRLTAPKEIIEDFLLSSLMEEPKSVSGMASRENSTNVTGKFYKAMFAIQNAAISEFGLEAFFKNISFEERLVALEENFKIAVQGGGIGFARETLGRSLYTFIKIQLQNRVPLHEMNVNALAYLNTLKKNIGSNEWDMVTASSNSWTLTYVVDTTGSMYHEIQGAKEIAKHVANNTKDIKLDFLLSPFNDPGTGPVIYRSSNESSEFFNDLQRIHPKGGRDCPELAFKGMINALEAGPKYGSPLFVFTDATAKDDTEENMAVLKALAQQNDAAIYIFTSKEGCTGGDKRGIDSYKEIAEFTEGKVFSILTRADLEKFSDFVANSLQANTLICSGKKNTNEKQKERKKRYFINKRDRRDIIEETAETHFVLDNNIAYFELEVQVPVSAALSLTTVADPSGKIYEHTQVIGRMKYYDIRSPVSGKWKLLFPEIEGIYSYDIRASTGFSLESGGSFIIKDPKTNTIIQSRDPIKDRPNDMLITVASDKPLNLAQTKIDLVDSNGNDLMKDIDVTHVSGGTLVARFIPPDDKFRVRTRGETSSGDPFQRTSTGYSRPTNEIIQPIKCGQDFVVRSGQENVEITFQVVVPGQSGSTVYEAVGKAYLGVVGGRDSKSILGSATFNLRYKSPNTIPRSGTADQITIRVCPQRCYDDEKINALNNYSHTFTVLII